MNEKITGLCYSYECDYDKQNISFVSPILRKGKPSHGGDRNTFELMVSTKQPGTLGSVASLLAGQFYLLLLFYFAVIITCVYFVRRHLCIS